MAAAGPDPVEDDAPGDGGFRSQYQRVAAEVDESQLGSLGDGARRGSYQYQLFFLGKFDRFQFITAVIRTDDDTKIDIGIEDGFCDFKPDADLQFGNSGCLHNYR